MTRLLDSETKVRKVLLCTIIAVILIDQAVKFAVKLSFPLYDGFEITPWFKIFFIENRGMAFGLEMGSKLFLSLFRVAACAALIYYLHQLIKRHFRPLFILVVGILFAGAIGNLIDSVFYGMIFSHSCGQVATLFPESGGYAPLFQGKVVDMLYFPIITTEGGEVIFFSPVFNVADIAVTVSVFILLIFFNKDLTHSFETRKDRQQRHEVHKQKMRERKKP